MNESDLQKLVDLVQSKKEDSSGGWIASLAGVVLFLIVVAVFAFQAWQAGKEKARLLHEAAVKEEEANQAQVDARLAANEVQAIELLKKVSTLRQEADLLASKALQEAVRHHDAMTQINSISSWEDVDRIYQRSSRQDHP